MSKGIRRMTVNDAAGVHAVELESFATPWTLDAFEAEMTKSECLLCRCRSRRNRRICWSVAYCG